MNTFDTLIDSLTEKSYAIIDNFLTEPETQTLRETLLHKRQQGQLKQASIGAGQGQQVATEIRGDQILWIDDNTAIEAEEMFLLKIRALSLAINRACFLGIRSEEIHYAFYPVGAFYKRHVDTFQSKKWRVLSVICYLNQTDWLPEHGGHLVIYTPTDAEVILPIGGRLVCFESESLPHEVLPAQRERYSLTGWLKR